jgi:hypothetical protein
MKKDERFYKAWPLLDLGRLHVDTTSQPNPASVIGHGQPNASRWVEENAYL